jgi:hypothetical protein
MSTCSNISEMSVSYNGDELPLEIALDNCFRELIGYQNHLHCNVRELCQIEFQDQDYCCSLKKTLEIHDGIDEMNHLFKELKNVCSQILGKPSIDDKIEAKKILDEHKLLVNKRKELLKLQLSQSSSV